MQRNKTSRPKGFLGKKYTHRAFKHIKAIFQRNMSTYNIFTIMAQQTVEQLIGRVQ